MNSLLKLLLPPKRPINNRTTVRDLIRKESSVGSRLFGIVRPGHRREFFCLDATTWVWYEEWIDAKGHKQSVTTRYEIHGKTLLKHQTGHRAEIVHGDELANFSSAVRQYYYDVAEKVYNRPISAQA